MRWIKAMSTLGAARQGGFAVGPPRPRRQFAVASWRERAAAESFAARAWEQDCDHAWHVLLEPFRARGTFRGRPVPFGADPAATPEDGPVAVLTLGRARWPKVPTFAREGAALTHSILRAPGLVTALSAGFPATGNATFSIWRREDDMASFAFAREAAHRATVETDRRTRILAEQIAVRFAPVAVRGSWDAATTPGADRLAALAGGR